MVDFSREANTVPKTKIVVVGDAGVGKSSIVNRFCSNTFNTNIGETIGVDTRSKIIQCEDVKIRLELWDTAGQERYRSMIRSFFKNTKGVVLVFDLTSKESLDKLREWLVEVENDASRDVTKIILGNKSDLVAERIPPEIVAPSINELTLEHENIIGYSEVSALTGYNVIESFQALAQELIVKKKFNLVASPASREIQLQHQKSPVQSHTGSPTKKHGGCGCGD